jgi:formylglycine-generating enzyme required for sulfatase activity
LARATETSIETAAVIERALAETDPAEAYAYACWLEAPRRDGRLVLPREIPAEHVIRLPDEVEREWAARYPDGRVYPWGAEYRAGCANIDEKVGPYYLGPVTAVGLYPHGVQSSLGLYDLSGNVSEWCQTNWSEEGYRADNDPRVLRHWPGVS